MSDKGNQNNNGPHQDQIFDKPLSGLFCEPKIGFGSDGGGVGAGAGAGAGGGV